MRQLDLNQRIPDLIQVEKKYTNTYTTLVVARFAKWNEIKPISKRLNSMFKLLLVNGINWAKFERVGLGIK